MAWYLAALLQVSLVMQTNALARLTASSLVPLVPTHRVSSVKTRAVDQVIYFLYWPIWPSDASTSRLSRSLATTIQRRTLSSSHIRDMLHR